MINIEYYTYLIPNNNTLQCVFDTFFVEQNQQQNQIVVEEQKGESNGFVLIYYFI